MLSPSSSFISVYTRVCTFDTCFAEKGSGPDDRHILLCDTGGDESNSTQLGCSQVDETPLAIDGLVKLLLAT